jgi:ankyrin repeat protein
MARHKDKLDVQQGGEHGRTALHIAAIYDFDECARILVCKIAPLFSSKVIFLNLQITQFGAVPRKPCNNGYYPIHEAAKNASSKTMEVFLQWGEARGCSREEMISFFDSEGNVPLHSAVHGGDIKVNCKKIQKNYILFNPFNLINFFKTLKVATQTKIICCQTNKNVLMCDIISRFALIFNYFGYYDFLLDVKWITIIRQQKWKKNLQKIFSLIKRQKIC